ncbi:hypothetical protein PVAP13_9NG389846 [Panicum virgatum]|uniref:Uncharacterized protein n=1 Tax=Panicum virgatum TaxID=38727 RepID=A0A8T0MTF7_PANVG|nr:hypothetical protein PVAP13_9NG389846 [Panicum virgatum]
MAGVWMWSAATSGKIGMRAKHCFCPFSCRRAGPHRPPSSAGGAREALTRPGRWPGLWWRVRLVKERRPRPPRK